MESTAEGGKEPMPDTLTDLAGLRKATGKQRKRGGLREPHFDLHGMQ
jgi:hypothetical protein